MGAQVSQDGLKLNGTHQLLVYADDVNMFGGYVHTLQKNTKALLVSSMEIGLEVNPDKTGLEVNADKTKYNVMSRDQNARQSHNIKIDNSFFVRVEEFKYLGTTLTYRNSMQEEVKSRLKPGNACYHLVQNIYSSSLLYKNLKFKIYRTIILPIVLYECEIWSLTLREEHRLTVFENCVLRRIFGPEREEATT